METKRYTQFGTVSVIVILPLFLLFAGLLIRSVINNSPDLYIHLVLAVVFLFSLLTIYRLTITIDQRNISFQMGIGIVRKSYEISKVKACHPVTNSLLIGLGIRLLSNGWLYNVSGRKAIELQFKDKKSVVRIGTNRPEEISALIQSMLGEEAKGVSVPVSDPGKRRNALLLAIILLIIGLTSIPTFMDTRVTIKANELTIKGVYGLTISSSDIVQMDTISALPGISYRSNGYAMGKTLTGNFKMTDGSSAKLFIKRGSAPYLRIIAKGKVPIYLNFKERQKTIDLFNRLTEIVGKE